MAGQAVLSLAEIYDSRAELVWRVLYRLGVREADLEDVLQEVFVVVGKRLSTYDGSAPLESWIFGISVRVAAAHRRRAYVRREHLTAAVPESPDARLGTAQEESVTRGEAGRRLSAILDRMGPELRAAFVLFELDELSCQEIAKLTEVPLGTVYSRLHAARTAFATGLARLRKLELEEATRGLGAPHQVSDSSIAASASSSAGMTARSLRRSAARLLTRMRSSGKTETLTPSIVTVLARLYSTSKRSSPDI